MGHGRISKNWYFALEGLNSFSTSYFFSFILFFFRDHFGFGPRGTMAVGAMHGLVYTVASVYGGKFSEKFGALASLRLGFGGMMLAMLAGGFLLSQPGQLISMCFWSLSMCFTWPALEALISEGEDDEGLPRMVGMYNLVWAGTAALGYFVGGAIYERYGRMSLCLLPAGIHLLQLVMLQWCARGANHPALPPADRSAAQHAPEPAALTQAISPETFLKLAWLSNPFAYVAITALNTVIPDLALRLKLSPEKVGIFCSIWLFTRLVAFGVLWQWRGWHYRFRYLVIAFVGLVASFLGILLAPQLWVVAVAQVIFGASTGLIYYSSLFYSMDVGEASGEHGGLHEAAIGLGVCAGPAMGAAALQFFPGTSDVGVWAVGGLLVCGLTALVTIRWRHGK